METSVIENKRTKGICMKAMALDSGARPVMNTTARIHHLVLHATGEKKQTCEASTPNLWKRASTASMAWGCMVSATCKGIHCI
jgi:hypothetical protein